MRRPSSGRGTCRCAGAGHRLQRRRRGERGDRRPSQGSRAAAGAAGPGGACASSTTALTANSFRLNSAPPVPLIRPDQTSATRTVAADGITVSGRELIMLGGPRRLGRGLPSTWCHMPLTSRSRLPSACIIYIIYTFINYIYFKYLYLYLYMHACIFSFTYTFYALNCLARAKVIGNQSQALTIGPTSMAAEREAEACFTAAQGVT